MKTVPISTQEAELRMELGARHTEIKKLQARVEELECDSKALFELVDKFAKLQTENQRLRKALEYYANPESYLVFDSENARVVGLLEQDSGGRARQALAGEK